jgi:NAD(P)H-quinone oxidoreductase subunit 5
MTVDNQSQTIESNSEAELSLRGDASTDNRGGFIRSRTWIPARLTQTMWTLWIVSVCALIIWMWRGGTFDVTRDIDTGWISTQLFSVDGVTLIIWVAATFFSGIVHSYTRRYLAGEQHQNRFFVFAFGFTLAVIVLVVANHIVLFTLSWVLMGLLMTALIVHRLHGGIFSLAACSLLLLALGFGGRLIPSQSVLQFRQMLSLVSAHSQSLVSLLR